MDITLNSSNFSDINFEYYENDSNDLVETLFELQDYDECLLSDHMESVDQFLKCFRYFSLKSIFFSLAVFSFSILTVVFNIIIIIFILKLKRAKTVFDKIFIGHAFADAIVGLAVVPNYIVYTLFGYWPLGKLACHFYVSFDYTICHVSILHMVFIAYCRLRSLLSPKSFEKEFFILHSELSMFLLWIISSFLWLPAVNLIIHFSFKSRECYFNFEPYYIIVQDIVAYLIPMSIILGFTIYILRILNQRDKDRKKLKQSKVKRKFERIIKIKKNNNLSDLNNIKTKTNSADESNNVSQNRINETLLMINSNESDKKSKFLSHITSNGHEESIQVYDGQSCQTNNDNENNIKKLNHIIAIWKMKTNDKTISNNIKNNNDELSNIKINILTNNGSSKFQKHVTELMKRNRIYQNKKSSKFNLNAVNKLYMIIIVFIILWLPFCLLWPISSICQSCNQSTFFSNLMIVSYWMGYGQSLINPILLLILNPNYNKLKSNKQPYFT